MKGNSLDAQLAKFEKLANLIGIAIIVLMFLVTGYASFALYLHFSSTASGVAGHILEMILYPIIMFAVLLQIGGAAVAALCDRFAPSYIVEEREGALLVWGSVPLMKIPDIKRKITAKRQNYHWVDNAHEKFGCTLAAVSDSSSKKV